MTNFCRNAIAYLKVADPTEERGLSLSTPNAPVLKNLGNGLCVAYVVDNERGLVYVQHRHLLEEKISAEDLHKIGLNNLKLRSKDAIEVQQHGPIFAVMFDGNFEASMILSDGIWDNLLAQFAKNGFIVAIPARDVLAFCDAKSEQGIFTLKEMIRRVSENGDHLLSKSLYGRRNGEWIKLS
ncbi:DUF1444 family protein [Undibacterium sp. TJN19]|uniref:DUF1444 family protein n=1 Tax=Undibacterium sp. TJN19 TaxID=3413055 RepID=UPI003BF3F4DF